MLFDGKPEAIERATIAAAQRIASIAKERETRRPAEAVEASKLASRYSNPALGGSRPRQDGGTIFNFGQWHSTVASRKNDDGTTSFISIDPMIGSFNFVVSERNGKKALIIRDAQHEYAFLESALP